MNAAAAEGDVDYRALAWSKYQVELIETPGLTYERIRGIPNRQWLRQSLEWRAWLDGHDFEILHAKRPKMRRRKWKPDAVNGAEGSTLW